MNALVTIEPERGARNGAIALRTKRDSAIKIAAWNGVCTTAPSLTTTRRIRAMADGPILSADVLRQLLRYDPETGKLFWLARSRDMVKPGPGDSDGYWRAWHARFLGKEAFTAVGNHGYHHGRLFGRTILAHRAGWAIVHGVWPDGEIDHINSNRQDNRLANLRVVTPSENRRNQTRSAINTSGFTGVSQTPAGKWTAQIKFRSIPIKLGTFLTRDEAIAARAAANLELGFSSGHGKEKVS